MTSKLQTNLPDPAICPCCGRTGVFQAAACRACGARCVAEPLAQPDVRLPRLGGSLIALGVCLMVLAIFALAWVFGNDLKVGRVFLVWLFGDSFKYTRDLLRLDPALPFYRIFTYDAYRLAFYLSIVLIPLSLTGLWLARRARRLIRNQPARFGGLPIANAALALSLMLTLTLSAAVISSIPRAINQSREKHAAATRASMYQIGRMLREYNAAYGRYPDDLSDPEFLVFSNGPLPQMDYWEKPFIYDPATLLASRENALGFSNYRLISAGSDGLTGNSDDLVLQDGIIVSASAEQEIPSGLSVQDKLQK